MLLCVCSSAQTYDPTKPEKISITLADGTIELSDWILISSKPYSFSDSLKAHFQGKIQNKTKHEWIDLSFKIIAYNKNGAVIPGHFAEDAGSLKHIGRQLLIGWLHRDEVKVYARGDSITDAQLISRYEVQLLKAEMKGTYKVSLIKPSESESLAFEDESLSIQWQFTGSKLLFELRNKTDNPISIDWNQVSYVDSEGNAKKITHDGVKYANRTDPQPVTTLPPSAKIQDVIIPVDNVRYVEGFGWTTGSLFPIGEEGRLYKGKNFSVFFPLEINGTKKNYSFKFQILDVIY